MDVNQTHRSVKKIKYYLVFFCLAFALACGPGDEVRIERIDYSEGKAVGVAFATDMDVEKLRVFVGEQSQTSVIGVIVSVKNKHRFSPVIPFMPGQTYTLRKADTLILASFSIPERKTNKAAELRAIYPQVDTVPENLLKIYLEFAQPMQEVGDALDFITVTNETDARETQPFLRLESELWNKEHTLLTLWLDPGRIKTDLIPNRERGLPLIAGKTYTIHIDNSWKSAVGVPLKQPYTKQFYVGRRDHKKPDVKKWQVGVVESDSIQKIHIDFGEPLDAFLARETLKIQDSKGEEVQGEFRLQHNNSGILFVSTNTWLSGIYELMIQSRLEDLAGNNLNHLFETNRKNSTNQEESQEMRRIPFEVD